MEPIRSLSELFPDVEIDPGVDQHLADQANNHISKKYPEAGELFLGPQPGLRVIEVDGVLADSLKEAVRSRDIIFLSAVDKKSLEESIITPNAKNMLRIAMIQFDALADPQKQMRKAMGQDVDMVIIGFFDNIPMASTPLYESLFLATDTGHAVVGIMSPGRPSGSLDYKDYIKLVEERTNKIILDNEKKRGLIARAEIDVHASSAKVWDALTNPDVIKQYMFGTTIVSDWKEGAPIIWKGEWKGKPYEDKGIVLQFCPQYLIQYSHFSALSGEPDIPENYHTVTIEISIPDGGFISGDTKITLTQDQNATEKSRDESAKNWAMMLEGLKKVVEK